MKKISRLFSSLSLLLVLMPSCRRNYSSSYYNIRNHEVYKDISLNINEIKEGENYHRYKIDITNSGNEYALVKDRGISINYDSEKDNQESIIQLYNGDNFLFSNEVLAPKDSKTYYISSYEEIKINENDKFSTYCYSLPAENTTFSNTELVKSTSDKYLIFKYQTNNFDFKNYEYFAVIEFEYNNTKYAVSTSILSSDRNEEHIYPQMTLESDNLKLISSKVYLGRKIDNSGISPDVLISVLASVIFIITVVVPIAAAIIIPLSISKSRKARQLKALDNNTNNNNNNNNEGK